MIFQCNNDNCSDDFANWKYKALYFLSLDLGNICKENWEGGLEKQ